MSDRELKKWSEGLLKGLKDALREMQERQDIINEFYWSALSSVDKEALFKKLEDYHNRDKEAIKKEQLARAEKMIKALTKGDIDTNLGKDH